jgi:hypothetical protein
MAARAIRKFTEPDEYLAGILSREIQGLVTRRGRMKNGFAPVAWPAQFGASGIITFIISEGGIVFQKDLGPDKAALARAEAVRSRSQLDACRHSRVSRALRIKRAGWVCPPSRSPPFATDSREERG